MTEKDINDMIDRIGEWEQEKPDERAAIILTFDGNCKENRNLLAGESKRLISMLASNAAIKPYFHELLLAAVRLVDVIRSMGTSLDAEENEGNIDVL